MNRVVFSLLIILTMTYLGGHSNAFALGSNGNYVLGREPLSPFINSVGSTIFYKDFVSNTLYSQEINGKNNKLLYKNFDKYINIYGDDLYFVNTHKQLINYNIKNEKSEIIFGDTKTEVYEPLIINDILYYITRTWNLSKYNLYAYYLDTKQTVLVTENVNSKGLRNFKSNLCFFDKDLNLKSWDCSTKKIINYGKYPIGVLGNLEIGLLKIFDNGDIITYKSGQLFKCNINNKSKTSIGTATTMYNCAVTENEIYFTPESVVTLNNIISFSIKDNKTQVIANTKLPLIGKVGDNLFCASSKKTGDLLITNIKSKETKVFVSNTKK